MKLTIEFRKLVKGEKIESGDWCQGRVEPIPSRIIDARLFGCDAGAYNYSSFYRIVKHKCEEKE